MKTALFLNAHPELALNHYGSYGFSYNGKSILEPWFLYGHVHNCMCICEIEETRIYAMLKLMPEIVNNELTHHSVV